MVCHAQRADAASHRASILVRHIAIGSPANGDRWEQARPSCQRLPRAGIAQLSGRHSSPQIIPDHAISDLVGDAVPCPVIFAPAKGKSEFAI